MIGHSLPPDTDTTLPTRFALPIPAPVTVRLIRWALLLMYAGLIGAIALTGSILAVYAGSILPTSFATVILRWFAVIVLIAASPNIAGWVVSNLLTPVQSEPDA